MIRLAASMAAGARALWRAGALWGAVIGALFSLVGCGDSGSSRGGYTRQGGQWHFDKSVFVPEDPATFEPLTHGFARDARRGYYRGTPIAQSDGATLEVLGEHEARDRQAVYYADTYRKGQEYWLIRHVRVQVVQQADVASYRVLSHGYARDVHRAYYEGEGFAVRDAASFEPMSPSFARDAQRGYYERHEIAGSDGASFALVDAHDDGYVRDKARVYHGRIELDDKGNPPRPVLRTLKGADAARFRVLGRGYGSDGARVWYRGVVVTGVDAAAFSVIDSTAAQADDADAQDTRRRYRSGVALPAPVH